jgi:N-carbamoylputrescine amidase
MRVAACQMDAQLARVPENLARAERLLDEAFARGATWVVLPEFFPSAISYHPAMQAVAMPFEGAAFEMMRGASRRHHGHVGGSFICSRGPDSFNTFVLVRPDGTFGLHDKDMPTMWEGCYYRGGSDDGIVKTEIGDVGVAMCWEFIRWGTARRLAGKIELLLGASCWPTHPKGMATAAQRRKSEDMMRDCFGRMARILGVSLVHANHVGSFPGRVPFVGVPYVSHFMGESQILDAEGQVLARARHEDGECVIVADVTPGRRASQEVLGEGFWIPDLPVGFELSWRAFNWHAQREYASMQRRAARSAAASLSP